jgi:ribonucleoside-diphosphate reductase alpha chain
MQRIAEQGYLTISMKFRGIRRIFVTAHDISPKSFRMRPPFSNKGQRCQQNRQLSQKRRPPGCNDVYELGIQLDCKGVTFYRDGSRDKQFLRRKERGSGAGRSKD